MKNVDVPIWDKGDNTDDYTKGGSSKQQNPIITTKNKKEKEVKEIFQLVLNREPSSRELSYYKYSLIPKEEIISNLLDSDEHKNLVEKGFKYPELEKMNKLSENTILKLRTVLDDKEKEIEEMKNLLKQEKETIETLRDSKDVPFITDKSLLDDSKPTAVYSNYYKSNNGKKPFNEYTLWERILNIFFGKSI